MTSARDVAAYRGHFGQTRAKCEAKASETLAVVQVAANAARLTHAQSFPRASSRPILSATRLSNYATLARATRYFCAYFRDNQS